MDYRNKIKVLFIIPFLLSLMVVPFVATHKAKALDTTFFDDSGASCDVSNCASTVVKLVTGETQFVQRTGVNTRAYFNTNTGLQLTFYNPNFCPTQAGNPDAIQNGDHFASNGLAVGTATTKFDIKVNGGSIIYNGTKQTSTANCNASKVINLPVLNVATNYDYRVGKYFVDVIIDNINLYSSIANCTGATIVGCDGILNYFSMAETGTAANNYVIVQKASSKNGYEVTAKETAGNANVNFVVRFGSDCSVTAPNTPAAVYYYDIDNDGGAGAQQNGKITMRLLDATTGLYWNDTTNKWQAAAVSWTPSSNNNVLSATSFTVDPGHKYVWYFYNVYTNNVIQYSTPYDGIFAIRGCQEWQLQGTSQVKNGAGAYTSGTISANVGDTVYFTHAVKNLGPVATGAGTWTHNIFWYDNGTGTDTSINGSAAGNNLAKNASQTFTDPGTAGLKYVITAADAGKTICQRIGFDPIHNIAGVASDRNGRSSPACVTVNKPPVIKIIPTITGSAGGALPNYEKGSADVVAKQSITANICDNSGANHTVNWSSSSVAGTWSPGSQSGTFTVPDCGATDTVFSAPDATIAGAGFLDGQAPGFTYTRSLKGTYNGVDYPTSASGTVYEVPFARFFGQDTVVCGDGEANRFMFDASNGKKGSFSSLASIFKSMGASTYAGLHTQEPAGTRDTIRTAWSSLGSCNNPTLDPPATITTGAVNLGSAGKRYYNTANQSLSGFVGGQVTINDSGNVTISGDITSNIPTGAFDYATAPVLLIHANNIYINSGVHRIDAVLVASGDIYTCGNTARSDWDTSCNSTLIINGALYANKVHFMRSTGSRLLSNTSISDPGTAAYGASNANPAEIVNYPAYLNFMALDLKDQSSSLPDAYYNMPPRL